MHTTYTCVPKRATQILLSRVPALQRAMPFSITSWHKDSWPWVVLEVTLLIDPLALTTPGGGAGRGGGGGGRWGGRERGGLFLPKSPTCLSKDLRLWGENLAQLQLDALSL